MILIIKKIIDFLKKIPWKIILMVIGLAVVVISLIVALQGCLSMPDCGSGDPGICCDSHKCMYLNQKNPDKSACIKAYEECCKTRRWDKCKIDSNGTGTKQFQDCWDKLD